MSVSQIISFCCPACQAAFPLTEWITITPDDPVMREQVLTGTLFHTVCPHCGKHMMVAYNCLYQDNARRFAVSLRANSRQPAVAPLLPRYRMRLERTLPAFVERVRILDAGLDDMSFELFRTAVLTQVRRQFPDKPIDAVRFDALEQQDLYLQISQTEQIKLPFAAYRRVEEKVKRAGFHPKVSGYLHIHGKWLEQSGILNAIHISS